MLVCTCTDLNATAFGRKNEEWEQPYNIRVHTSNYGCNI